MTEVKRLHRYLLEQDQDGSWFTFCHACSFTAGHHVYPCANAETPAPPFKLVEQSYQSTEITPDVAAQLAEQWNLHLPADQLQTDIVEMIEYAIRNRPRSQQKAIGPSEIGHECTRWLGYKLAGVGALNPASERVSWRTQVGTWVHEGLATELEKLNERLGRRRFLVEQRVSPGVLVMADNSVQPIYGSGDAYDCDSATVLDWKIVGPTTLKKVKAVSRQTGKPHGASLRYRIQGMLYGVGFKRLGLPVRRIVIAFLPAAGELSDAYFHAEDMDVDLAEQYIARMHAAKALTNTLPLDTALELLPTADHYCTGCPYFRPTAGSLSGGCPGDSERKIRKDPLLSLIPPEGVSA